MKSLKAVVLEDIVPQLNNSELKDLKSKIEVEQTKRRYKLTLCILWISRTGLRAIIFFFKEIFGLFVNFERFLTNLASIAIVFFAIANIIYYIVGRINGSVPAFGYVLHAFSIGENITPSMFISDMMVYYGWICWVPMHLFLIFAFYPYESAVNIFRGINFFITNPQWVREMVLNLTECTIPLVDPTRKHTACAHALDYIRNNTDLFS